MSEPIAEGWVSVSEAADSVGYSTAYVRLLARKGRIEARKVNQGWLVDCADLVAFKRRMTRLGDQKHNPWRDDLEQGRKHNQSGGDSDA